MNIFSEALESLVSVALIQSLKESGLSVVANKKGELFSEENLTVKRPGTGISPMKWDNIIAKVANRDYKIDELIKL